MATTTYANQHSSQRSLAMVLSLVSAVVLSPLYITKKRESRYYETQWSSGFVLPMFLVGLIIAIRMTSSSCSSSNNPMRTGSRGSLLLSSDPSWVHKIGTSSWGLAGILIMLMLVLSWQNSVHDFLWR